MQTKEKTKIMLRADELQLGDVVKSFDGPFNSSIVQKIDQERKSVKLFRPYGVSKNFSYTGGVICYTGIEEYEVWLSDKDARFELLERKFIK